MKTFSNVLDLVRVGGISDSCKEVVFLIYDKDGNCLITDIETLPKAEKLAAGLKQRYLTIVEKTISAYKICRTIEKI